jgi:hypothetical protein
MPDEHRAFFTPNTKYRAPMFVATSLRYAYVFTLYAHCVWGVPHSANFL